ncbi:MAG TPA: hypothetical protein VKU00_31240 [Chthonomonadaceae bacterium]|nr:hypothetical protein [Chthonomonadaceae bacterium]
MQALAAQATYHRYLRFLPFLPVLIALGVFLYMVDQHTRAESVAAEKSTLESVSLALGMPITATKAEVYARLNAAALEHDVARRAWFADKAGINANWDRIFQHMEQMNPEDQRQFLHLLTSEYHLPDNMPIGGIKKNVSWRGAFVETHQLPIGQPQIAPMMTIE